MSMRALLLRVVGWSITLFAVFAHAESPVPTPLEPWRAWVMHGQEFRACPLLVLSQLGTFVSSNYPSEGVIAVPASHTLCKFFRGAKRFATHTGVLQTS